MKFGVIMVEAESYCLLGVAFCSHLEWYELSSILAMLGTRCLEMEYSYKITLCHFPETAVFVGEMQAKFLAN